MLDDEAFLLRFFADDQSPVDRLLLVNFGRDLHLNPAPEPLLAPPDNCEWELALSTENPRYGGGGIPPLVVNGPWLLPGQSAAFLLAKTSTKEAAS